VRSGSRVRGTATIAGAERVALGVRVRLACSIEIEGESKPALVAETLTIFSS
jgi:hypothetical protein